MIQSKFYNYWDKCHYSMLSGVLRGYLPNRLVDTGRKGFGPRHLLPLRAMFQWILPFHHREATNCVEGDYSPIRPKGNMRGVSTFHSTGIQAGWIRNLRVP